jgi:hypothetical protein
MVPASNVSKVYFLLLTTSMRLTCVSRDISRRVAVIEQEGCCDTGSIANSELYATGNRAFSVSGVVDWSPREGSSGGRVQACCYNETASKACFGADVGDEQDVAKYADTDGHHGERSSLLNLVAVPGAGEICQTAQGVDGDGQSLSSEIVSSIGFAGKSSRTDELITHTWILDQPLPLRLMIVGRKTLKL